MTKNILKTLLLCIFLLQPVSGWSQESEQAGESVEPSWSAPEIIALPVDWWPNFISEDPEVLRLRAELLTKSINGYASGLDADNLVAAQTGLNTLRTNLDTALTLVQGIPITLQIDALPILDQYSLQQFLGLRKLWREGGHQLKVLEFEEQQVSRQSELLAQRRGGILAQYNDSDPSSPARLLAGLQRINLHLDLYSLAKRLEFNTDRQSQLESYLADAEQKIKYAAENLTTDDLTITGLDSSIQGLKEEATNATGRLAAVQQKLLDTVNAGDIDSNTMLNLKQQMTLASVEELLARLRVELEYVKRDLLLVRSGDAANMLELHKKDPALSALLRETTQQSELWTDSSQNTLITPEPDKRHKTRKAYDEAQRYAHRTLGLIDDISATTDNLSLVEGLVASESLTVKQGIGGIWFRIKFISQGLLEQTRSLLNISLFHIAENPVTPGGIIKAFLIFLFFWGLSWLIRHFLERLEKKQHFDQGSFYAGGRVLHYVILTIAGIAALGSIGLDFSNFALIAGALSVGIGFGLQSVVLNFVSGLILLFEGSIRVGDYVELDSGLMGSVKEIRSRATLINTNDNVDVIVPNSELVSNRMINWTLKESTARMRIPFSVAYGSDKDLVQKAVLEAAAEGKFIIQHMPRRDPSVRMVGFGDSALDFELLVWVNRQGVRRPIVVRSTILWAMDNKFREYGIEVPFPQRDLHVRSGSGGLQPQSPTLEPSDQ